MRKLLFLISLIFLLGCAMNIPTTTGLNDFLLMNTKANIDDTVSYSFESEVSGSVIKPYNKSDTKPITGHPGYKHTENFTLQSMIDDYFNTKFTNFSDPGGINIHIILKDFHFQRYSVESTGMQALKTIGGVASDQKCIVNIRLLVKVKKDKGTNTKIISASDEDIWATNSGDIKSLWGKLVDKTNNKAIMMLNNYLTGLNL